MAPSEEETQVADLSNITELPSGEIPATTGAVLDLTQAAQEVATQTNPTPQQPQIQLSKPQLLNALRAMWGKGQIKAADLQQIAMQLRIPVSYILKGKVDVKRKKRLKKLSEISRRRNRYNGSTKGQTKQHYHKALGKV